jgi:hypothetical protein
MESVGLRSTSTSTLEFLRNRAELKRGEVLADSWSIQLKVKAKV